MDYGDRPDLGLWRPDRSNSLEKLELGHVTCSYQRDVRLRLALF
jgi:hypothetical protein